MDTPREASWCWRRILECRAKASKLVLYSLGNGEDTLFWKEPWHPMGTLMEKFPQELLYDSTLNKEARVSAIIRHNTWCIPNSVRSIISNIASRLKEVEIDDTRQDEIVWKVGNSGQFQSKATYEALRKRNRKLAWTVMVWYKGNIPRHSFITWLLVNGALKTLTKLNKWGVTQHDTCPLCNIERETDSHLFFECNYSQYVWSKMLHKLSYSRQVSNWEQEILRCIQHFKGNSCCMQLKKVSFNATIYYLWAERNNRLYAQQSCTTIELVRRIHRDIHLKFSIGDLIVEDNPGNRQLIERWNLDATFRIQQQTKCSWVKPPTGWHKMNSDGSLRGRTGGYGAVIRSDNGEVVSACAGSTTGHSVVKHELQGVEAGLKLASKYNIMKLELCTDSTTVFEYLTKERYTTWNLRHTISRIMRMLGALENYKISHTYRETNRLVDKLASLNPSTEFTEIIPSSFAQDLKDIVNEDRIGKIYLRM